MKHWHRSAILVIVRTSLLALAALALSGGSNAVADDGITPIAAEGDWMATEHQDSITDAPDVCMAMELPAEFALRADSNDVEFRLVNTSWALPADVSGNMNLAVNGNKYSLAITSNTNNMVAAAVSDEQLLAIAGDMNKSGSMTVTVGNAPPVQVSLSGSNSVMTAFLTCADIQPPAGTNGGPGSNPFQSATPASQ